MPENQTGGDTAMLLLIRETIDGLKDLRSAGAKQSEDFHAVRLTMAGIEAKLEPITAAVTQVSSLNTRLTVAETRLGELDDHDKRITTLEAAVSEGKGWQGFGGKLLYLIGGALVTAIIATGIALLVSKPARASDVRIDPIANAKCMAAPAKPRPKYLRV